MSNFFIKILLFLCIIILNFQAYSKTVRDQNNRGSVIFVELLGSPLDYSKIKSDTTSNYSAYSGMTYMARAGYHFNPFIGLYAYYLSGSSKNKKKSDQKETLSDTEYGLSFKSFLIKNYYTLISYGFLNSKLTESGTYSANIKLKGKRLSLGAGFAKRLGPLILSLEAKYTISSSYSEKDGQSLSTKYSRKGYGLFGGLGFTF